MGKQTILKYLRTVSVRALQPFEETADTSHIKSNMAARKTVYFFHSRFWKSFYYII